METKNKAPNDFLVKRNSLDVSSLPGSIDSAEKLFNIFKIYGKCEVSEFDAEVRTAKVFFHHHKGAKKARDKMQEFEIEGQKLAVDWSFVFGPKNTIDGEEKKTKKEMKTKEIVTSKEGVDAIQERLMSLENSVTQLINYRENRDLDLERTVLTNFIDLLNESGHCPHSVERRMLVDENGDPYVEWDGAVFGTSPHTGRLCLYLLETKMSFSMKKLREFGRSLKKTQEFLHHILSSPVPTTAHRLYREQCIFYGLFRRDCDVKGIVACPSYDAALQNVLSKRKQPFLKLTDQYKLINLDLNC